MASWRMDYFAVSLRHFSMRCSAWRWQPTLQFAAAEAERSREKPGAVRASLFLGKRLGDRGIYLFRFDAELLECLLGFLGIEVAVASETGERGSGDVRCVDLEVDPQVLAVVAASEAVGAECEEAIGQPR